MNIYVGNLSYDASDQDLETVFGAFGKVKPSRVIMGHETNQPRGFGVVEMADSSEAKAAIAALNGTDLLGRIITASEMRTKSQIGDFTPYPRLKIPYKN